MSLFGIPLAYFVLAVLVAVVGVARLTRLVVSDSYPPVLWLKEHLWDRFTGPETRLTNWWVLVACPWCLAPYIMGVCMGWALADIALDGLLDWMWWVFWGWLALSYAASWVTFHDEDGTSSEE